MYLKLEIYISAVCLHFDSEGITAMVRADAEDEEEDGGLGEPSEFLVNWNEVLSWCMACCEEEPDSARICQRLRAVADKLEEWKKSDDPKRFEVKIDTGQFPEPALREPAPPTLASLPEAPEGYVPAKYD